MIWPDDPSPPPDPCSDDLLPMLASEPSPSTDPLLAMPAAPAIDDAGPCACVPLADVMFDVRRLRSGGRPAAAVGVGVLEWPWLEREEAESCLAT